jgi:hypothetical protein
MSSWGHIKEATVLYTILLVGGMCAHNAFVPSAYLGMFYGYLGGLVICLLGWASLLYGTLIGEVD